MSKRENRERNKNKDSSGESLRIVRTLKPSRFVYDAIIADYQERLEEIRSIDSEDYTRLYTRFVENVVKFCNNNDLKLDDVMLDIELKK